MYICNKVTYKRADKICKVPTQTLKEILVLESINANISKLARSARSHTLIDCLDVHV